MSTRGAVAVGTKDKWKGVFNHWDSYPRGLGKEVWDEVQDKGIEAVAAGILGCGDWREYQSNGICEYCGKVTGQPHSIRGEVCIAGVSDISDNTSSSIKNEIMSRLKPEIRKNLKETGYPDPEAKYHKHGQGVKDQFDQDHADPLFLEWVYILDVAKRQIHILQHISDGKEDLLFHSRSKKPKIFKTPIKRKDGFTSYGHCAYKHAYTTSLNIDDPEPDWEKLDEMGPKPEKEDVMNERFKVL